LALRVGDRVVAKRRLGGPWDGWVEPGIKGTLTEDRGLFSVRWYVVFDNGVKVDWLKDDDLTKISGR
jgi:hypothetical protein